MLRLFLPLVALGLLSSLAPSQDLVDRLVLADGEQLTCRVLFENAERVVVRAKRGDRTLKRSEVSEIVSVERSLRELLDRFATVDRTSVLELASLAEYADTHDLPGEARNLWMRILTVDPNYEPAWQRLGGSFSKSKGWRLRVRGRYLTIVDLRDRVSDWKNALELTTAHFLLRTDVQPELALDLALDMERAYFEFYDTFTPHLDLFVFSEQPQVNLFASADEYPKPVLDGLQAWYSTPDNILYVNGAPGAADPAEAMRHFSDQLMFTFFKRTLGRDGVITPFVSRGVGELFGSALQFEAGASTWEFGMPNERYFRLHAGSPTEPSLGKVINASIDDFVSGDRSQLLVAQAYTLVHFLVFADNGAYRGRATEFLVSAFGGQSSTSHFQDLFGEDLGPLEDSWRTYVEATAAAF